MGACFFPTLACRQAPVLRAGAALPDSTLSVQQRTTVLELTMLARKARAFVSSCVLVKLLFASPDHWSLPPQRISAAATSAYQSAREKMDKLQADPAVPGEARAEKEEKVGATC